MNIIKVLVNVVLVSMALYSVDYVYKADAVSSKPATVTLVEVESNLEIFGGSAKTVVIDSIYWIEDHPGYYGVWIGADKVMYAKNKWYIQRLEVNYGGE